MQQDAEGTHVRTNYLVWAPASLTPRPRFPSLAVWKSVLKATESWAGPGNEVRLLKDMFLALERVPTCTCSCTHYYVWNIYIHYSMCCIASFPGHPQILSHSCGEKLNTCDHSSISKKWTVGSPRNEANHISYLLNLNLLLVPIATVHAQPTKHY